MLHYFEPTLEIGYFETALIDVGVNDLLNDKSPNKTDNLTSNLVNIVMECKSFGATNLFVSGIAFNKRLPLPKTSFIKKANKKIADMRKNYEIIFFDNDNIYIKTVYTYWNEVNLY